MGLFEHWPYTNFHELNLNWIIQTIKGLETRVTKLEAEEGGNVPAADASGLSGSINAGTLARLYAVMDSYRKHNNDLVYMHKPSYRYNYATGLQADGLYYGYSALQTPAAPTYGLCGTNSTPYQDAQGNNRQGLAINCTTFVILSLLGIPYNYTTYNSAVTDTLAFIGKAGYAFNPWDDLISAANLEDYYNTQLLYERFKELGLSKDIDRSFRTVKAGDVLFQSRNGSADGIFHCGICLAVAPVQVQLNNTSVPTILICEVRNAPYPVTFRWRSAADLIAEGWQYACSPDYGVTEPYAADLLMQRAVGTIGLEQITGLPVANGEIITLDFDYTPRALEEYFDLYINGEHARTPNRPLHVTQPASAAELGVTRHITFPVPIQANAGMVSDPNTFIESIGLNFHGRDTQNNDQVTNLRIYRGLPASADPARKVIRPADLSGLQAGLLGLFPASSRNYAEAVSVDICPTASITVDSTDMFLTTYPAVIYVSDTPTDKRCKVVIETYGGRITGTYNGSAWTWQSM